MEIKITWMNLDAIRELKIYSNIHIQKCKDVEKVDR